MIADVTAGWRSVQAVASARAGRPSPPRAGAAPRRPRPARELRVAEIPDPLTGARRVEGFCCPLRYLPVSQPPSSGLHDDVADPEALRHREVLVLHRAAQDGVGRLQRDEALPAVALAEPERLDDLPGLEPHLPDERAVAVVRRAAEVADLALAHEVVERRERLLPGRRRVGPVDLVEVDDVRLQPTQAVLDLLLDRLARQTALVGTRPHRAPDLGREHRLLAPPLEGLADDLLRLALRVDVGRVDEVDAGVERAVDDADALLVAGVAPLAEHHRAETQRRDLETGVAEVAVVHGVSRSRT